MSAPNYPETMTANAAAEQGTSKPSPWAKLHRSPESWRQTAAMMAVFGLAPFLGGAAGWLFFGVATVAIAVVWPLVRHRPASEVTAARSWRRHDPWRDAE